ncbi:MULTISPECIES: hypothetical protein [unclassified Emticicia]|uniref:hypothetical protein n=1 Tax=unclassified Emticicia TaxID=2627301 RepID=UPI000C78B44E|nr:MULTISPECIES: hypothetical protein [unclassified Emticicia]PLK46135.1 hypothetical protein C0V77_01955 [Emticicia sp. TH156]UTA67915.1 hypothetical protein MB380_20305 [Emticicia sp. 21SJ11W-3]
MNIQLINGEFSCNDALQLVTQMVHAKIRYHESKIALDSTEEDIKYRESRIKGLQKELFEFRNLVMSKSGNIKLDAVISARLM